MIFLHVRPVSQTHDSYKGHMVLNHESTAGRIKTVVKSLHLVFATFVLNVFLLAHGALNNIGKNQYRNTPQKYSDHYFPWETRVFTLCTAVGEFTGKDQHR